MTEESLKQLAYLHVRPANKAEVAAYWEAHSRQSTRDPESPLFVIEANYGAEVQITVHLDHVMGELDNIFTEIGCPYDRYAW